MDEYVFVIVHATKLQCPYFKNCKQSYILIYLHIYSIIIHKINRLNTQNKQRDGCQNKRAVGVSGGTGGNLFTCFFLLSSLYHFSCHICISFLISSSHVSVIHLLSYWLISSLLSLLWVITLYIFLSFSPCPFLFLFHSPCLIFSIIFSSRLTSSQNNQSIWAAIKH